MDQKELNEILEAHKKWLNDEEGGIRAVLRSADLRRAVLRSADLRRAVLTGAVLTGADLTGADLTGADLTGAVGYFGKHHAIAAGGFISIGCERHSYDEWMGNYKDIGKANGYTDEEIERYGAWIKLVVDWLKESEAG